MRTAKLLARVSFSLSVAALVACGKSTPSEPEPTPTSTSSAVSTAAKNSDTPSSAGTAAGDRAAANKSADDPLKGVFTLADATKDLKGGGTIVATIETSMGTLQCKLLDDKAPTTVANFIGLATGKRTWKDPSGQWVNKPAYDGTGFHRIIKGFMIQGGDARGNGSGEPGYVIPDELWAGGKHDRAGLMCMANRGPNTNGAQFFITDAGAAHLDRSYTIFGECAPVEIVHQIAGVPTGAADKPQTPVTIKTVTITRDDKKK